MIMEVIMERAKVTIDSLMAKKKSGKKITMMTAYDYPTGQMVDQAGIDTILVGDSVGTIVLGYPSTVPVTMEEMIHHAKAVTRGVKYAFVIGDMPFMSYQAGIEKAVENAGRLMKEGGCDAVKLEGGSELAPVVKAIATAGIPVCPHIGLTPQTATKLSGLNVQGEDAESAKDLVKSAKDFEKVGAFMIVVVCVPELLGTKITKELSIPTLGLGAGRHCDGQILVYHDTVGLAERPIPEYKKQYIKVGPMIVDALKDFKREVEEGLFPGEEHVFQMSKEVAEKI
jgi:3-methyl-2-oxobutanoate hydroxymethyltransferase